MEARSNWWTLGFMAANLASALYGFLQGAWPFGLIELFWAGAAFARWRTPKFSGGTPSPP
ncbi:MAG: hypothetical protein WCO83_08410 [Alphaproteobacteria bacterium]